MLRGADDAEVNQGRKLPVLILRKPLLQRLEKKLFNFLVLFSFYGKFVLTLSSFSFN